MIAPLIDSHCHLADRKFDEDREEVIERALDAGVTEILVVGGGGPIESSEASAELAATHSNMRATAGIHPHDASSYDDAIEARIEALLVRPEVTGVGETGLDYYYEHSEREAQRSALARHVRLARKHDLPIVLHCRDADEPKPGVPRAEEDLIQVLQEEAPDGVRGVVHCFTGSQEAADAYLAYGLFISFSGILTFNNSQNLRDIARRLPMERLLVETDSPYLTPVPHRKVRRNEPAFVAEVAAVLAGLHGVSTETIADQTTANTRSLFFTD